VGELGTAHTRVPGVPVGLRQAPAVPARRARRWRTRRVGIEFVTHIMQELNWSPFYLQSGIEEIKLLYLIFNGKKNIPQTILCFRQIRSFHKKKKSPINLLCPMCSARCGGCGARCRHGPGACVGLVAELSSCPVTWGQAGGRLGTVPIPCRCPEASVGAGWGIKGPRSPHWCPRRVCIPASRRPLIPAEPSRWRTPSSSSPRWPPTRDVTTCRR